MGRRDRALMAALTAAAAAWLAACARQEPAPATPAEPPPAVEVRASVDPAVATTGDVITYRVSIDADQALELEIPEPGAEIAGFRIFDLGREEPRVVAGRRLEERWYKLRADLVGSYVLPPIQVRYRSGGNGEAAEWQTIETSALFVEVESVLPAAGEAVDIRGLKPLRPAPQRLPWPWIAAAAALVAAVAAGVWRWRRRPRPAPPVVPPHEQAFRELDRLRGTDFDDRAAVRRFHFRISEVVRAYVEGRWGLNATDLTSEEIIAALDRLEGLPAAEAQRLGRFLAATDRVKFAEHRPARPEVEQAWEDALGFVEATMPQPETPAQAEPERRAA